ncbi:MAG: inositol monophosphatase [Nitrospirae bacterium]|nr:inositol monophosphatase [Nitrospirota bacterium]
MLAEQLPPLSTREALKTKAIEAARLAGAILNEHARHGFRVEHKDAVNLVTDADRRAEQAIVDVIKHDYPTHQILAEERGLLEGTPSLYKWVIDPLDGTTNFAHGYPAYCVSIGLEYQGRCILGVVFDPTRQELFVAEAGGGAFLNGTPIHVSHTPKLDAALLVTGFAYDIRESPQNNLDHFARFALRAQGVRRTGSAALDLCYVSAGRFDGFWELKLHPWDTAAGALIVTEAGGQVTDLAGDPFSIYRKEIVASNGLIHDEMLEVLREP